MTNKEVKSGDDRKRNSSRGMTEKECHSALLLSFPRKRESSEMDPPVKPGNDKEKDQVGE